MTKADATTAAYVTQRVSANLNIVDVTPQSKINTLTQALLNEDNIFNSYNKDVVKNMFIQTATVDFLEYIGISDNIVRTKEPMIRFSEEDAVAYIIHKKGSDMSGTMEVGSTIQLVEGAYWIRLNKAVDLTTTDEKVYLNGDLIASTSTDSVSLLEGSIFPLQIGNTSYNVILERSVYIPMIEEDIENYRERVVYGRQASKTGSVSAIRLAISAVSLVTDYTINFETSPYEILIFNKSLLETDEELDSLTQYALPVLSTRLNSAVSEGSVFTINIPKKINFTIKLIANKPEPKYLDMSVYTLIDQIKKNFRLGQTMRIDMQMVREQLLNVGDDASALLDYKLVVLKNFLGNSYESSTPFIDIGADEYPYLSEVIVE